MLLNLNVFVTVRIKWSEKDWVREKERVKEKDVARQGDNRERERERACSFSKIKA